MPRKRLKKPLCLHCEKECARTSQLYCSNKCQMHFQTKTRIAAGNFSHRMARGYLLKENGYKCEICQLTEWLGSKIPLVLDHINGISNDNRMENLRLVCGNCDMQLPTFKRKNIGNGRQYRRERYLKGKSY